jgi:hypothetical protein
MKPIDPEKTEVALGLQRIDIRTIICHEPNMPPLPGLKFLFWFWFLQRGHAYGVL